VIQDRADSGQQSSLLSSPTAVRLTSPRQRRHDNASPVTSHGRVDDDEMTFSDVGAMDLSMKKPRRSSPSPAKPPPAAPPCAAVSKPSSSAAAAVSGGGGVAGADEQAMTDALVALFSPQQSTYGAAELAQLLAAP